MIRFRVSIKIDDVDDDDESAAYYIFNTVPQESTMAITMQCTMVRFDVIPSSIQQLFCILIGCIFFGVV